MMEKYVKRYWTAFTAALAVSIVISVFLTHTYDVSGWSEVCNNLLAGEGLYGVEGYYYTPVWGYFLSFLLYLGTLFGISPTMVQQDLLIGLENGGSPFTSMITDFRFVLMPKLFMILTWAVNAYLIYHIVKEWTGEPRKAYTASGLWLICPLTIVIIARSAMFESLTVMLLLLSLILLWRGQYFGAGALWAMASLTKYFPFFLIFIFVALILVRNRGEPKKALRQTVEAVIGALLMSMVIYLPLIIDGTVMDSLSFITSRVSESWLGIYDVIYTVSALIVSAYVAYCYYKRGSTEIGSFFKAVLTTLLVVYFLPVGPEQYYIILAPFMAIGAVLLDRRLGTIMVVAYSLMIVSPLFTTYPSDFLVYLNAFGSITAAPPIIDTIVDNLFTAAGIMILWLSLWYLYKGQLAERKALKAARCSHEE